MWQAVALWTWSKVDKAIDNAIVGPQPPSPPSVSEMLNELQQEVAAISVQLNAVAAQVGACDQMWT